MGDRNALLDKWSRHSLERNPSWSIEPAHMGILTETEQFWNTWKDDRKKVKDRGAALKEQLRGLVNDGTRSIESGGDAEHLAALRQATDAANKVLDAINRVEPHAMAQPDIDMLASAVKQISGAIAKQPAQAAGGDHKEAAKAGKA